MDNRSLFQAADFTFVEKRGQWESGACGDPPMGTAHPRPVTQSQRMRSDHIANCIQRLFSFSFLDKADNRVHHHYGKNHDRVDHVAEQQSLLRAGSRSTHCETVSGIVLRVELGRPLEGH